ncbi:MAG TPA: hypothetical protein VGH28_10055 [Polyangiaceae bacterium]
MELDPKDDDDRALLRALPAIGSALITLLGRAEERIVVLFSTRPRETALRVLPAREAAAQAGADQALASAIAGAPSNIVRVISLRRDGSVLVRDVPASDLTEAEDTFPA